MKKLNYLILSVGCLLFTGCDLIDYHPYDVRIEGETDINAHHIEQIEAACLGKDTIHIKCDQTTFTLWII